MTKESIKVKVRKTYIIGSTDADGNIYIGTITEDSAVPIMAFGGGTRWQDFRILSMLIDGKYAFAVKIIQNDGSVFANKSVEFNIVWAVIV